MNLFPFTTLESVSAEPTITEIAKPIFRLVTLIALATGGFFALSRGGTWPALIGTVMATVLSGGGVCTAIFYAVTRIARRSGYRPFVFTVRPGEPGAVGEAALIRTLTSLGFTKESEQGDLGSVWTVSAPGTEENIVIKKKFP